MLSSDEEDDEDKRKARKKWRKEQERRARELKSNLAQLGASPVFTPYESNTDIGPSSAHGETQAFVQAYQGGLASDDDDDEAEASQDQVPLEDDQAKDDDEEEDAPIVRNRRSIGIRDIEDQVRMIARQNREREEAMQVSSNDTVVMIALTSVRSRTSRSSWTLCRCPQPLSTRTPIKRSRRSRSAAVAMNSGRGAERFVSMCLLNDILLTSRNFLEHNRSIQVRALGSGTGQQR